MCLVSGKLALSKGPVIKYRVGGGGWGWAMKIFLLSTGFQWPTPELFDKIGAAQKKLVTHPPTKTSNADVDRYIREHWLTTLVR